MKNSIIFQLFLYAHIVAGSTALLTGLLALWVKKKRGLHSKTGLVFHYAMIAVSISAFVMAVMHMNYFLFVVAIFSFYLTFTGDRSILFMRNLAQPNYLDRSVMILSGVLMLLLTAKFLSSTTINILGFSTVILVFDAILVRMIISDFSFLRKKNSPTKNDFLIRHITRMIPAYIATTTAFLVVNIHYKYPVFIWLAPTVLFIPVLIYHIKKYKKVAKISAD